MSDDREAAKGRARAEELPGGHGALIGEVARDAALVALLCPADEGGVEDEAVLGRVAARLEGSAPAAQQPSAASKLYIMHDCSTSRMHALRDGLTGRGNVTRGCQMSQASTRQCSAVGTGWVYCRPEESLLSAQNLHCAGRVLCQVDKGPCAQQNITSAACAAPTSDSTRQDSCMYSLNPLQAACLGCLFV